MPQFEVAHLNEQGQNMIVIPLADSFGSKSSRDQNSVVSQLQAKARSAGMAGTVVVVWDSYDGRMAFMAPTQWRELFKSLSMMDIARSINKQLSW